MLKLDIGCSDQKIAPDFIGIDPYVDMSDIKADAGSLPYRNNEVDEIYSSHMLEHLPKNSILPTLREWFRVLKPEGKLKVLVPDLVWCCKWWLEHQTIGWDMDIIFGTQGRPGEFHQTGFSEAIMSNYLAAAGFLLVKFERLPTHSQETMSFECTKPQFESQDASYE